jgi:FkbH-like protein
VTSVDRLVAAPPADARPRAGADARLASALCARLDALLDTWDQLGEAGPTCGSPEAGSPDLARAKYLLPLAKVLVGGLAGSSDHSAVYLDERLRYVDPSFSERQRAAFLRSALALEIDAIAELVCDAVDANDARAALWHLHAPLVEPADAAARLLFIGDCLFVETRAFLTAIARDAGRPVDVRQVFFSANQQIGSVNTAIVSQVTTQRPHVIGISLFTFEGVPPYAAAWQQAARPFGGARALSYVDGLIALLDRSIADIRTVSDAPIVVHSPCGVPLDRVRRRVPVLAAHSRTQTRLLGALHARIDELVDATENTILLDEADAVAEVGGVRAAARPAFAESDVPPGYFHTTRLGSMLARTYAAVLDDYALLGRAKAIFVDFDNTLWKGVMAEGPVEHDFEAQTLLRDLKQAGVLLIALSKNDPASIRWEDMALQEEDFVLTKINWNPKADNASAAIAELDLAQQAFVLLDDNPAERALVSEQVHGIRTLDPGEPSSWRSLRRWLEFPSTTQTEEASRRTAIYREAAERRSAINGISHDYAAMMQSLSLCCTIRPAGGEDKPRVLELVQRTNQFNTTTRRRSAAEIDELLVNPRFALHAGSLKDRFGDLGIVALAIFDREERSIDSVIMSCRAMGFGLELALMRAVLDAEGDGPTYARFIPTDRNAPAADLFERAGFHRDGQGRDGAETWILLADAPRPEVPSWLTSAAVV